MLNKLVTDPISDLCIAQNILANEFLISMCINEKCPRNLNFGIC